MCVAGRNKQQYYVDNKQTKDEYQKKYDDEHKEQILKRMRIYNKLKREKKKIELLNINSINNGVQEIV